MEDVRSEPGALSPSPNFGQVELEAVLRRLAGDLADPLDANGGARSALSTAPGASQIAPPVGGAGPDEEIRTLGADILNGLLDSAPDALVVVDERGRILRVNAQTERLFGYRRQELLGRHIEAIIPERFLSAEAVPSTGNDPKLHGRRQDGREIPIEIRLSSLPTDGGPLVVASIRDISERKWAEAKFRKMGARYRTLVEGIPAVTFMAALDEGRNELYVSPQIEALLGFSQKEWLDNPVLWYTQLHPKDRHRWHIEFAHTCATGEPFRSVYRFIARDGRTVWVHGEAKVVRDDDGQPLFLQGVAFDITGIKQAEEDLKALNRTLERRVAEGTAMAEERAQELARSNAALEQFGYVVAHDLRAPLRTMKSYIQKLAERYQGRLDAQADDYIDRGVRAADRMRVLIDDLLAFSRVRTQGKEAAPTACAAALDAALADLAAAMEEAGAEATADALPIVLADPTQLAQLFENLIANALKFRADRPPRLHVGARREGDFWVIAVADNGIGVEPQYLRRIFGLGERLYSVSQYPGNGIGLATCEKIVQRHGGQIWAESPGPDRGCAFYFTLPAAPD